MGCRVDEFRGIIDLLSFLIDNDRFDVVDKLGNALSERIALEALYEALRVAKSMGEVQLPARREIERFVECLRDPSEFYRVTRAVAAAAFGRVGVSPRSRQEGGGRSVSETIV